MNTRFLLIDDDADDRSLFSEALAMVNPVIVCDQAADGEEALSRLHQTGPDGLDIIFLDINMPVMNGWQLLKILKREEAYRNIPVVIYSTSSNKRDISTAYDLGALCFVTKPHAFRLLQKILGVVVDSVKSKKIDSMCDAIHSLKTA